MNKIVALAAAVLLFPVAALAQAPPGVARGVIVTVGNDTLTLKLADGSTEQIALGKDWKVSVLKPVSVDTIQPGSFIGTAEMPQKDGTGRSLEVHVFPPSLRGMGEGHRPWDQGKGSSMTNGTVGKLVVANGDTMTVTYHGGQKIIVVPPDVPIVSIVPGDRALLTVGAHVSAAGAKDTDGSIHALNVSVGLNGLVPPT